MNHDESITLAPGNENKLIPGDRYRAVQFRKRSPLSDPDSIRSWSERCGYQFGKTGSMPGREYDLDDQYFCVQLPTKHDSGQPPGLVVWIPGDDIKGDPPEPWVPILDKYNLVWVGAHNSSNAWSVFKRFGLALDAVHNLPRVMTIDEEKVFMTGFSGGGKCAAILVFLSAAVPIGKGSMDRIFRGGLFLCGAAAPGKWPEKTGQQARKDIRLVFLTGDRDFNLAYTQEEKDRWLDQGFRNIAHIQVPGMEHTGIYKPEAAAYYEKAIRYLLAVEGGGHPESP
ncbi:MAG: hypothetical protein JXR37_29635 [Kiritimatiellae bacterium]|nr:hypothetical protein [Kiritimatiellia bacterium]